MHDANLPANRVSVGVATPEGDTRATREDTQYAVAAEPWSPLAHPRWVKSPLDGVQRWSGAHVTFPTWLPLAWRMAWIGYVASGVLTTVTAAALTGLSIATHGTVQLAAPLLLVDIIVALIFGSGPSLLAALLGTVLIDYFINPPHFAWSHTDPGKAITLAALALVGSSISLLASRVAHARSEAEALSEELRKSERETSRLMDEFLA